MGTLLFYSLVGGLFSLIGGLVILWKEQLAQKLIIPLLSFGAGAFLSVALVDLLPEAIESLGEPHPILLASIIGFTAFFVLERIIMKYMKTAHAHGHSDHTESLPYLLISGDCLHNFLDGVVIAIAYAANPVLGLSSTLATAAHEIPQEIGDFSILLKLGWPKAKIIGVNVMQSLLTIPGVFVGYYLGGWVGPYLPILLGLVAGIFLYIAASDLIPELHHTAGHTDIYSVTLPFILGAAAIWYLSSLTH